LRKETELDRERPKAGVTTESVEQFTKRATAALAALYGGAEVGEMDAGEVYAAALRCVLGMLAVLSASEQIPEGRSAAAPLQHSARLLREAAEMRPGCEEPYRLSLDALCASSRLGVFCPVDVDLSSGFCAAARALFSPRPDLPIDSLFFQTMPLSWIGQAYQRMLALRPTGPDGALQTDRGHRKTAGIFFTPPHLVRYVVESALGPLLEAMPGPIEEARPDTSGLRILDPAVGGGDFLAEAVQFLSRMTNTPAADVVGCVYGYDLDPIAIEVARFRVWAAGGFADGAADTINQRIVCADALSVKAEPFDAVLGNPPYIASKNGLRAPRGRGQSDTYLLFLQSIVSNGLVRKGGTLSMVLPDPLLVRGNAAAIRRAFVTDWTLLSLLHVMGSFPDAHVANAVPVLQHTPGPSAVFCAARVERAADQHAFALRPVETVAALCNRVRSETVLAQERCELLYLLDDGPFGDIVRRIHGPEMSLAHYEPPFAPLRSLNVSAIYRGEEVGKSAIQEVDEGLPMLLGGQSVHQYEVTWEGRRIPESRVEKPRERYARTKILIQKSSPRVIAALDRVTKRHPGYVFPQSVYAVELREPGMDEYYLLCLLNSRVLSEYIWRTVTAYKMVQPQLEIEDIKALPIRVIEFGTPIARRRELTAQAIALFEREQAKVVEATHFPELDNFAAECMSKSPERSDVVHDVLSHLGREIVDLTVRGRKSPDPQTIRRLEAAKAAVDTIVWRLYSSQPSQMTLLW
jgi:SAM-dependent methyltransferase